MYQVCLLPENNSIIMLIVTDMHAETKPNHALPLEPWHASLAVHLGSAEYPENPSPVITAH